MIVRVSLDSGAKIPTRAHKSDAGFDLYTPVCRTIEPNSSVTIDSGVHIDIPFGYVGFLKSKSRLNVKHGITSEGVIDSGFAGSIQVKLYNHSEEPYTVEKGDKITQLVILPIPDVELVIGAVKGGERGSNGFGSTGR